MLDLQSWFSSSQLDSIMTRLDFLDCWPVGQSCPSLVRGSLVWVPAALWHDANTNLVASDLRVQLTRAQVLLLDPVVEVVVLASPAPVPGKVSSGLFKVDLGDASLVIWDLYQGSGGGTSGRGMAFCLGRPGLNPRMDLGFFQFRIVVNLSSPLF